MSNGLIHADASDRKNTTTSQGDGLIDVFGSQTQHPQGVGSGACVTWISEGESYRYAKHKVRQCLYTRTCVITSGERLSPEKQETGTARSPIHTNHKARKDSVHKAVKQAEQDSNPMQNCRKNNQSMQTE